MRYTISGKNINITPGLKDAVESKLGKLERYFSLFLPLFPFKCTTCTNHTFDSPVILFIHTNPPKLCGKLSTSKNADFTLFRSYTPSYPHYPQVFPPHRWILPSLYICFIFVNIL